MINPEGLTSCVECGHRVSQCADRCPHCGLDPKGIPCRICNRGVSRANITEVKIPQDMNTESGYYSRALVHKDCWDNLVATLFPDGRFDGKCPVCGTPRAVPSATEVGYFTEWTCRDCGHSCSLGFHKVAWCGKCRLAILKELHAYWELETRPYGIQAHFHRECGQPDLRALGIPTHQGENRWRLHQVGGDGSWWKRFFA